MSINQFSSELLPETIWWAQQQLRNPNIPPTTNTSSSSISPQNHHHYHHPSWLHSAMFPPQNPSHHNFNLNVEDDIDQETDQEEPISNGQETTLPADIIKEPMFEKPLTPSDVGKLNRLVIPKQHAEKYFPLNGGGGGGGGGGEAGVDRGLLLSFEDEAGKCWRFRYSYWNSSQSYVLTKGWSRYVKEKQLDAGDVVLFERHCSEVERLFIGWRRRGQDHSSSGTSASSSLVPGAVHGSSGGVWSRGLYNPPPSSSPSRHHHLPYQPDCLHAGSSGGQSQTTTQIGNPKRLRLFGVNMECQPQQQGDESEPSTPDDGSSFSSSQGHHQFYSYASSSTSHNHSVIRHN